MQRVCSYVIENAYGRPEFQAYTWDALEACELLNAFFHFASTSVDHHRLVTPYLNLRVVDALKSIGKLGAPKLVALHGHASTLAAFLNNFFPNNHKCILKKLAQESDPNKGKGIDEDCVDSIKFTANVMLEVFEKEETKGALFVGLRYNNVPLKLSKESMYMELGQFVRHLESKVS